ncbi:hypothetical protein PanWU01x14_371660 [Parasponia andersonii]|uniref:Uncharacterized protein n=1 Tax=Parasponia andersonii TaxID=3476 RepID=A0A2P5A3U4_PARAD|nr:hypothetical protein PanWU01x14_371660 [Parasponia andersonii]
MTTFNPGKMELRYTYLDDPYDDTNPTRPVLGRMVARIVAGDEKIEMGQNDISGFFRQYRWRQQAARGDGASWQLGEGLLAGLGGERWPEAILRWCGRERSERGEKKRVRGEREKKRGDWLSRATWPNLIGLCNF